MRRKEKELLFQDLCARLPYEVKVSACYEDTGEWLDAILEGVDYTNKDTNYSIQFTDAKCPYHSWTEQIKPYLRKISSMTQKERSTYITLLAHGPSFMVTQWLDRNYFDHRFIDDTERHLIELGLALEVPAGMY